ncbi:hypothetical protein LCGC14_2735570 [marine sediment metagenome]|uniref:Uncharacterized protein n=1 Tax=marine sediment metagenome TaxID=412755 RepID=A0A0F8Z5X5_9ZZZZ
MKKQTWAQWVRACVKDPSSPSELEKGSLAALTGQDVLALDAIAACWALYAGDLDARTGALAAVRALLPAMLPENRWIARELIPFALNWEDRESLWPLVQSPTARYGRAAQETAVVGVEGRVNPETGAGVDALARQLTEKLGRAGQLPPKAQAEFDARERS